MYKPACMLHKYSVSKQLWTLYPEQPVTNVCFQASANEIDENCALLGYNTASSGNFLPRFRYNLSVPSFLDSWLLKMGCPETSIKIYDYALRNNPEDRSFQ